jgi:Ca2+-binding RTX toxin-like protein
MRPTTFSLTRTAAAGTLVAAMAAIAVLAPASGAGGFKLPECGPYDIKDLGKKPGSIYEGEVNDATEFIRGSGKNDLIVGGGGRDVIDGGGGDDIICGNGDDDTVTGGKGDDIMIGGSGDDELKGDVGDDEGQGKSGDDKCAGVEEPRSCEDVSSIEIPDFPF